jgi:hypothetical protein
MTTVSLVSDKRQLVEISPIYAASEGGSERSTKIAQVCFAPNLHFSVNRSK